ncbi:MAG TPA: hypothetical protein VE967_18115 [Gemmatimonadaceae bacterium]|nr:hypothetical protein [Gemmatimonadaceae bacterium]
MPYSLRFENEIVYVTVTGVFSPNDIAGMTRDIVDLEVGKKAVPHRIVDMSQATEFGITPQHLRQLAAYRRSMNFPNIFKSAIVVSTLVQFGHARMFQILNDHPQIRLAIFPSIAAAEEWLKEPGFALPEREWTPRQTPK